MSETNKKYKDAIAVVGAGPAGLMAAVQAAQGRSPVVVFERNEKAGKKLYLTGKGRCNVTNAKPVREFLEQVVRNPKFLYGALFSFSPDDTIALLERCGVKTKVERGGRVFPVSDKASDVTRALVREAEKAGAVFFQETVLDIWSTDEGFTLSTDKAKYLFKKVILACGGASYPATGSNGDGYRLAKKFGHNIVPIRPALVPICLQEDVSVMEGLTLKNVEVTVKGKDIAVSRFGEMLFTSRGVSGPVALTLSSLINRADGVIKLYIDLKPALDEKVLDARILSDFEKYKNKRFKNALADLLPNSLIPYIIERSGINPEKPVNSVTKVERMRLGKLLKGLDFTISALGDIKEAIVTSGGVCVDEVNAKTMESKKARGLFFAGEMLDVDALTGGYNIQIALSTGYVAGNGARGE